MTVSPNCAKCGRRKSPTYKEKRLCATCTRTNRASKSAKAHASRILATYGTTAEEYAAQYAAQGGRCAIHGCRATGKARRLSIDHDHKCKAGHPPEQGCPECRRGLLCRVHNGWLGLAGDDPEVFRSLALYLERPPWRNLT